MNQDFKRVDLNKLKAGDEVYVSLPKGHAKAMYPQVNGKVFQVKALDYDYGIALFQCPDSNEGILSIEFNYLYYPPQPAEQPKEKPTCKLEKGQKVTIYLPNEPEYHNRKGIVQRIDTHLHEVAIKFDDKPWNVVFDISVIKESTQQQETPELIELDKAHNFIVFFVERELMLSEAFNIHFSKPENQYHPKEQPASPEAMIEAVSGKIEPRDTVRTNARRFANGSAHSYFDDLRGVVTLVKFSASNTSSYTDKNTLYQVHGLWWLGGDLTLIKKSNNPEPAIKEWVPEVGDAVSYDLGKTIKLGIITDLRSADWPIQVAFPDGSKDWYWQSALTLVKKAEKPTEAKPTTEKIYSLEDVMLLSRRLHVPLRNHAEIQIVIDTQRKREKLQAELKALG